MKNATPLDGLQGLWQNWRSDLAAGFVVSLIALPLSLGIALASGMPPLAGIIAAVIGGLVVSLLNGSHVTINGPAAGLVVVLFAAVEALGQGDAILGYHYTLAAIVLAGAFIALFGWLRLGRLSEFFPLTTMHGMMSAIGLIIIAKQAHVMVGVNIAGGSPLELIAAIPQSLAQPQPVAATIGLLSMALMVALDLLKKYRWARLVPPPLIVALLGIGLGQWFNLSQAMPALLVHLPENVVHGLAFPDFGKIGTLAFWGAVLSITLVQGLETLLITSAVDQIDPYQRRSNRNRDLAAVGLGSVLSGAIGGLPIIAEIVRSSANINNGAQTRWANFFQGLLVMLFVLLLPHAIEMIPLASLAAILVFTGYKLAAPAEFYKVYKVGKGQFLVFVATIVTILATDLLLGIAFGILVKITIHVIYGARLSRLFSPDMEIRQIAEGEHLVIVKGAAIFTNYLSLKNKVLKLPHGQRITIDFTGAKLVDHTVMDHLIHLVNDYTATGGQMAIEGLEHLRAVSEHPLAVHLVPRRIIRPEFSDRQLMMAEVAEKSGFSFGPQRIMSDPLLQHLHLFAKRELVYEENVMQRRLEKINMRISDIRVREEVMLGLRNTTFTGLLLTDLPADVPSFSLNRETLADRIWPLARPDIDFHEHREFSRTFMLRGGDEQGLRSFFTEGLMNTLQQNPQFNVESNGKVIFIYKPLQLLEKEEMRALVGLAHQWLWHLSKTPVRA